MKVPLEDKQIETEKLEIANLVVASSTDCRKSTLKVTLKETFNDFERSAASQGLPIAKAG